MPEGRPPVARHRPLTDSVAGQEATEDLADRAARRFAVDPAANVVLEASAGTGKTRVLVERYVNLLRAGVDPDHVLAITFTRKAAAEMRERIIDRLHEAARQSELDLATWRRVKGRLGDIGVLTIDAFCLTLLRECPLEADVDPGFELADETQTPRLVAESLDRALRICRSLAAEDEDCSLVFAQLGERRLRSGLSALLERRLVAPRALRRFLDRGPRDLTPAVACGRAADRLAALFDAVPGGLSAFLDDGPIHRPQYAMLAADVREGRAGSFDGRSEQAAFRVLLDRLRGYFLKQDGHPRGRDFGGTGFKASDCASQAAWKRHRRAAGGLAPAIAEIIRGFRRDLNVVLSRGIWRIYAVALAEYQRTLESHALLDFSGVLERAVGLLKDLDEFAESRFRLEARYRHVLVDELQDTSRAQWELIAELVRSWGEGFGAAADAIAPSIFVVGDRKQSIYGFRDAEVAVIEEAAAFIAGLRPEGSPRQAISVSFRAVPELLSFVNDLFGAIVAEDAGGARRVDGFRYGESDRFPLAGQIREAPTSTSAETGPSTPETPGLGAAAARPAVVEADSALGLIVGETIASVASRVAAEIARLLSEVTVRDRTSGLRRAARPADIAILFRSRDSHRDVERALVERGILTYVYKGLGFFEADEVQDVVALVKYLADPASDARAAALLRSRLVRLSDGAIFRLAPELAAAISGPLPPAAGQLSEEDSVVFHRLRDAAARWLSDVDRVVPSDQIDSILVETAYAYETRGPARRQARENLKKLGAMVRRFENRGYATMARVAEYLESRVTRDESNAAIDAVDAVSLMTVHAAKGLEFPIVFIVNMGRGIGTTRLPIRVGTDKDGEPSVAIADYQSEADEDAEWRDREEAKRLLYVALTRARDRLYLSATLKDGQWRMGRGGLGDVLPASVKALFPEAVRVEGGVILWPAPGGRPHRFRVPDGLRTSPVRR